METIGRVVRVSYTIVGVFSRVPKPYQRTYLLKDLHGGIMIGNSKTVGSMGSR